MDTPSFPNDRFIQTLLCAVELESLQIPYQQIFQVCAATNISPLHLWHSRLGHTSVGKLRPLISRGLLGSVPNESVLCVSYQSAKQPALSFSSSHSHSTAPFDLVHSDVWGPSPTPTMGGSRYFVLFIDDHTRFTWIYLMKSRSELSQIYIDFATMVKTHILDSVCALLISSSCPKRFWGEAALTAAYLINRIPSSVLNNQSPYERLHGILLAYNLLKKEYRCWDPVSQKLRVSHHVVFWEHTMFSSLSNFKVSSSHQPPFFTNPFIELFPSDSNAGTFDELYNASPHAPTSSVEDDLPAGNALDNFEPSSTSSSTNELVVPSSSHPTWVRKLLNYLRDYHCFLAITSLHEPQSYQEASSNPLWQQTMQDELQALENTRTWDLVDLPAEKFLIGCKWVYKIKTRSDGSVERYKARLVAKGFTQEYGIDYEETFAPVARLTSVRSLLVIVAIRRWKLFQMDVKNAFLDGDLEEEVYMKPPPGLHHPPNKGCRLRRALYGLKQSLQAWYAKFSATVSEFGFTSSPHDTALFIRKTARGMVFLLLYVDDMIITGDDVAGVEELKQSLSQKFEMKDLGVLSYFLGLEVTSSDDGYLLSQIKEHYFMDSIFLPTPPLCFVLTLMLIGLVILLIVDLPPVTVFSLVILSSLSGVRNKLFHLALVQKLSIELSGIPHQNFFHCGGFLKIWAFLNLFLLIYIVIIKVLCILLIMMSFMNALNTLRLIVTLFAIILHKELFIWFSLAPLINQ
ncbi:hypothetical protein SLEP1_g37301 [Rubroshorea leprosula]|uniref:Reverse transcriptase Ty1/copia-type domain-containing protein n=1 Tax=Rubroshorea leprosula TaxID=152421 RepID=A0AAV5KUS2_9ROSI|nr:hypothetical protein SLEP1_g37301 [Rubroshorea leprosula]